MYLRYFDLDKEPFHITPDPAFFYLSPSHREALAVVVYGVRQRKGFIMINGEVGVGKTTVLRSFLERNAEDSFRTIYIFNANISFRELLSTICEELGLPPLPEPGKQTGDDVKQMLEQLHRALVGRPDDDTDQMLNRLHQALMEERYQGKTVVLVVDESRNRPLHTLENLRTLSDFEALTGKLVPIVFCGQPEFDRMLDRRELRQLKGRATLRAGITRLNGDESSSYLRQKLTLKQLHRTLIGRQTTDEVDRMLKQLHQALIEEYRQGRTVVVVIDEAQNMPVDTLENLRMLSNLETSTDKLIQIILCGQPEFDRMLDRYELRQLKGRIAMRADIARLNSDESADYIRHRLAKAGLCGASPFSRGATKLIARRARGIPRTINILCDNALTAAFGRQEKRVNLRIAGEIILDFCGAGRLARLLWWWTGTVLFLLALGWWSSMKR